MSVPELIRTENRGRETRVYVAGIEIGKQLISFSFDQSGDNLHDPEITLSFHIADMLRLLSELTKEDLEQAKEIAKPFIDGYRKNITEDKRR